MLHNSINISGLHTYPEKIIKPVKQKKIIVTNNFFCEKIPNYLDKFEILSTAISLNVTNSDLYLLQYETNEDDLIGIVDYLSTITNTKKYIFTIIDSYKKMLRNILLLYKVGISHFNINCDTLCFKNKTTPILRDWTTSLYSNKIKQVDSLLQTPEIYTNSPLEIYVIIYLNKYKPETLKTSSIEIICKKYVDNITYQYLSFITANSKNNIYLNSVKFMTQFLDMPREKVKCELMKYSHTWDNYSLSIIYLHIVGNILVSLKKKDSDFCCDWVRLLNKTMLMKLSIQETIDAFDSLFYKHTDWSWSLSEFDL